MESCCVGWDLGFFSLIKVLVVTYESEKVCLLELVLERSRRTVDGTFERVRCTETWSLLDRKCAFLVALCIFLLFFSPLLLL